MEEALINASADGDANKVEMLLSQGARVEARDQGYTPLLAAAEFGHTEVCKGGVSGIGALKILALPKKRGGWGLTHAKIFLVDL